MTFDPTFKGPMKIIVTFERREDGGLRVYSEDVPGFVLSHADCNAVMADVKPALEEILSAILKIRMVADPLPSLAEVLHQIEEDSQCGPKQMRDPIRHQDYLARVAA